MTSIDTPECAVAALARALFLSKGEDPAETKRHFFDFLVRSMLSLSSPGSCQKLRSVRWRLLLGLLPQESAEWSSIVESQRAQYDALVQSNQDPTSAESMEAHAAQKKEPSVFGGEQSPVSTTGSESKPPSKSAKKRFGESGSDSEMEEEVVQRQEAAENPLSPQVGSTYARLFEIQNLRKDIEKDVHRLAWDDEFFEERSVLDMIIDILLAFCTKHDVDYRQGMHEVVSFVAFAVASDSAYVSAHVPAISTSSAETLEGEEEGKSETPSETHHEDPAKATALGSSSASTKKESVEPSENGKDEQLVSRLMNIVKVVTESGDTASTTFFIVEKLLANVDGCMGVYDWYINTPRKSSIQALATRIQGTMLSNVDPELSSTLNETHDIQPASYLLRWLRLLFLRELPFHQCGIVWDVIFADYAWTTLVGEIASSELHSYSLNTCLIPHIAVAMLEYMRNDLVGADSVSALRRVMRYPPVESVRPILRSACIAYCSTGKEFGAIAISCLVESQPNVSAESGKNAVKGDTTSKSASNHSSVSGVFSSLTHYGAEADPTTKTRDAKGSGSSNPASRGSPVPFSLLGFSLRGSAQHTEKTTLPTPPKCPECEERDKQQHELGQCVSSVVQALERKWFRTDETFTPEQQQQVLNDYLLAIAELKRIRDVLLGNLD